MTIATSRFRDEHLRLIMTALDALREKKGVSLITKARADALKQRILNLTTQDFPGEARPVSQIPWGEILKELLRKHGVAHLALILQIPESVLTLTEQGFCEPSKLVQGRIIQRYAFETGESVEATKKEFERPSVAANRQRLLSKSSHEQEKEEPKEEPLDVKIKLPSGKTSGMVLSFAKFARSIAKRGKVCYHYRAFKGSFEAGMQSGFATGVKQQKYARALLAKLGVSFETGNDSPRGGRIGEYVIFNLSEFEKALEGYRE